ncbi:hypothetical protein BJF79_30650 [Actinomadura sp. CNU-125]|uniref:hypothetical protein n=1 Tax=Actinomadura sp. CNU-125 TaxID=1904961 RepID=UPI00095DC87B|nr:hypothetical protein [Actinomadura sp. CNU-125]OLT36735.1 hypothetical protein BJF79_30650 [Actinomadura sp. CNU-125]
MNTNNEHPSAPIPGAVFPDLNIDQAKGRACIVCRTQLDQIQGNPPVPDSVTVGTSGATGRSVRACTTRCAPMVGYTAPSPAEQLPLL